MSRQYLTHLLQDALKTLLASKKRSFLTMLGIIIGVAAVIVIMAIGAGAQSLILSQLESFGTNLVGVLPGKSEDGPPVTLMGISITTLTYDDVDEINKKKNVPHLLAAIGYSNGQATLNWRSYEYSTNINGVGYNYQEVEGGELADGRFFTDSEQRGMARVVVLGYTVKQELFGDNTAVGQHIKINKRAFEVIGVMKERGTVAFQDYDDLAFMPVTTVQKIILGVNHLNMIRGKIDDEANLEQTIDDIAATLRANHDIKDQSGASDDFTIRGSAQALEMLGTITDGLSFFLAAMAALSLLVGGIGIMNIMLIRVAERTREIGLRKAVGATTQAVMSQFLVESAAITFTGGIIGIIVGALMAGLIAMVAQYLGYDWPFIVPLYGIALAVTVSIAIGLIFGLYPAKRASKLNPIEALRYE
ncbi:MAG: ABC transporter permease [bacterium]